MRVDGYPALYRSGVTEDSAMPEKNRSAECFYHPGKGAVTPCDACGRMLCNLCSVSLNHQTLCLNCLHVGKARRKIPTLQDSDVRFDSIALMLAVLPLVMFFITIITAPAAFYFAIRHLKTPSHVLPKKRAKSIIALVLALLQIVGWSVFFINLMK